ncbi:ATP-binding cassette domain-containing protein [Clostridium paraputrificum]|uniref:ATP-binding cassette domain-containing protein n=1 Tax=Clostridium paraputrificum TaxID=29363 RepID=UPI0026F1FBA7|nr:ABC transporter ATP-binding protein [Clostridium paraputrificum]
MKKYFDKFIKYIILLSILIIISWIISLIMPSLVGKFIDLLVYENNINYVKKYIYVFIIFSLINIFNSYIVNIFTIKIQTKMCFSINFDIIEHLKKIPFLKIVKYDPIYLTQRITTDSNILISFFLNNYLNFFFKFITIIFSFYILYSIDITLTLILFSFIPVYIFLYILLKNTLYKLNLKNKNSQNLFFSKLTEQITNIKSIKINSSFELYKLKVEKAFKIMFKDLVAFSKISYLSSGLDNVLSAVASSIIFFMGGIKVINGDFSIGDFTIITTYFNMIMSTLSYYLNIGKSFQDCKSSFIRIKELLDISIEVNGNKFIENLDEIQLDKISFSYENKSIFNDFSYTFKSGNIYCIKGNNGVGKSTLLNIIIGLIESEEGSVYFNKINIKELDMYKIRKDFFSIIPQDYILKDVELENTIKEIKTNKQFINISNYLNKSIDIFEFLDKIELNFSETESNTFSGGENQKLSIFNVFFKNAKVIIMDEPTSSLDKKSINLLKKILLAIKKDKLIILISHDKYFGDICDEYIDLNNKKV